MEEVPVVGFSAAPVPRLHGHERVLAGLLSAVPALVLGIAVTVVLARAGLPVGISGVVTSSGAIWLYTMGARSVPRLGLLPLFLEIVLGLVASFFGVVANGLWDYYGSVGDRQGQTRIGYVASYLFHPHVIRVFLDRGDALFAVFAVVGVLIAMVRLPRS